MEPSNSTLSLYAHSTHARYATEHRQLIGPGVHQRNAVLLRRRVPAVVRVAARRLVLDVVQHLARQLDVVVCELANLGVVNAQDLRVLVHAQPQPRNHVHEEKNHTRAHKRVGASRERVGHLVRNLDPVTVDPPAVDRADVVECRNVVGREEGRQNVAHEAANAMHGKNVEGVIDAQEELELGGVVGKRRTARAEDERRPERHVARAGRDGDETGDDAGTEADGGPLALEAVVEHTPRDATDAGRQVRHAGRHDGPQVGGQGRSGVEAEPADPEEDGADDNVGDIVGAIVELVRAVATTLAEHHRVRESSGARGNVDGGAAGKVEAAHAAGPTRRVPCPAGNGVVDDGRPDEHEDDAGQHAPTLGDGASSESDGDGGEHALVESKQEIRDAR
ncbi:hypothetical protein BN1708_000412 [Verticillium longisporum]|uniref:Uncharacterized protein n=1 Tax=Verticillium longisporum TaxID=100787 RepID=A0A0G4LCG9_VERLO|nr:hypothetical protein BN1708_000412 [Verticillium longisporum]